MNEVDDFQEIDKIFNLFESSLKNDNPQEIRNCLKLVQSAENQFLETYSKRKKEGVYYTSVHISEFMVSETILVLLNKYLEENKKVVSAMDRHQMVFSLVS